MQPDALLEAMLFAYPAKIIRVKANIPEGAVGLDELGRPMFTRRLPISRAGALRAEWEERREDLKERADLRRRGQILRSPSLRYWTLQRAALKKRIGS